MFYEVAFKRLQKELGSKIRISGSAEIGVDRSANAEDN
jgi:hypothetical protein